MNDFEQQLKNYLIKTEKLNESDLAHDVPLFSSGILDSFDMIDLVTYIEKILGFRTRAKEITLENFDTIRNILSFVVHKAD